MSTASIILLVYFFGGLFALAMFDAITHKMRKRFKDKAAEAQVVMAQHGNLYIGKRVMLVVFAVITWLFWPFVLLGATASRVEEEQAPKIQSRDDVIGTGTKTQMGYWAKKIWYGECPDCHVILTPLDIWGQYAACPKCKVEYRGIRLKARKEDKHGETRQGEDSEDTVGEGGIDIIPGAEDSEQPDRATDSKESCSQGRR